LRPTLDRGSGDLGGTRPIIAKFWAGSCLLLHIRVRRQRGWRLFAAVIRRGSGSWVSLSGLDSTGAICSTAETRPRRSACHGRFAADGSRPPAALDVSSVANSIVGSAGAGRQKRSSPRTADRIDRAVAVLICVAGGVGDALTNREGAGVRINRVLRPVIRFAARLCDK
jgi:hypothetical protein